MSNSAAISASGRPYPAADSNSRAPSRWTAAPRSRAHPSLRPQVVPVRLLPAEVALRQLDQQRRGRFGDRGQVVERSAAGPGRRPGGRSGRAAAGRPGPRAGPGGTAGGTRPSGAGAGRRARAAPTAGPSCRWAGTRRPACRAARRSRPRARRPRPRRRSGRAPCPRGCWPAGRPGAPGHGRSGTRCTGRAGRPALGASVMPHYWLGRARWAAVRSGHGGCGRLLRRAGRGDL